MLVFFISLGTARLIHYSKVRISLQTFHLHFREQRQQIQTKLPLQAIEQTCNQLEESSM